MNLVKYQITVHKKGCIKCSNCYSLDSKHFEPDDDYASMVVNGEITEEISTGIFDDDYISLAEQAVEECPMEIIHVTLLT